MASRGQAASLISSAWRQGGLADSPTRRRGQLRTDVATVGLRGLRSEGSHQRNQSRATLGDRLQEALRLESAARKIPKTKGRWVKRAFPASIRDRGRDRQGGDVPSFRSGKLCHRSDIPMDGGSTRGLIVLTPCYITTYATSSLSSRGTMSEARVGRSLPVPRDDRDLRRVLSKAAQRFVREAQGHTSRCWAICSETKRVAMGMGEESVAALREVGKLLAYLREPELPRGLKEPGTSSRCGRRCSTWRPRSARAHPARRCLGGARGGSLAAADPDLLAERRRPAHHRGSPSRADRQGASESGIYRQQGSALTR